MYEDATIHLFVIFLNKSGKFPKVALWIEKGSPGKAIEVQPEQVRAS
jgi:hypothetical protein